MQDNYSGLEKRQFPRINFVTPLDYKVCKKETISKLLEGYTSNISQVGLLCNIKDKVEEGDILWLSFDRTTLNFCTEIEKRAFVYQNGIIGKVVRITPKDIGTYDLGIQFVTREEKNFSNIYPKIHFLMEDVAKENE